ncbi:MAG: TolA-binding protein [Cryomorphaceae bacterium]|jgi:TolA-binding protein
MPKVLPAKSLLFVFMSLFFGSSFAQQTEKYRSDLLPYYEALALMERSHYEPARKGFEEFLSSDKVDHGEFKVNALYYRAKSAMELFHKDAEFFMEEFVLGHPESIWYQTAVLDLGRYNFNRRDYDDALRWLKELDQRDLDAETAEEVEFKMGFAAFELEDYEQAKKSFYKLKNSEGPYSGPTSYYYGHIAYTEGNYQTALESFNKAESDENFAKVVPYYVAQIYHYQEKYDELIEYATPLLAEDDVQRGEEMALLVGNAHYSKEQYAEAVPFLEMYMASTYNPAPEDSYRMGYSYYRTGDFEKAIDYFTKASKEDNALGQIATYQLADSYLELDQKKYAQNAFKLASKQFHDPEITEDALFNYAKLAYELSYDPFHEAIIAFEQYLKTYPNSDRQDEAFEFLLKVHLATKNYSAAIDALDKIKTLDPIQKEHYQLSAYNLGVENMNKKNHVEALKYFAMSKKYNVNPAVSSLADYWRGDIAYRESEYDDAISAYRTFLNNPSAYGTDYYNLANYNIGYCAFKSGDYDVSLIAFRKYVTAADIDDKRKNDAYLRIGDLHLVNKNYKEAITSYEMAVTAKDINVDYALFQQAMAEGYADNFDNKTAKLRELLTSFPQTSLAPVANFELGTAYFMQNKLEPSLVAFNTVVEDYSQSPYRKRAMLQRGLVQYRLGKYDDAIATYEQVVEDYGVDSESQEAIATLKNIYLDLGRVEDFTDWLGTVPDYEVSPMEIDSLTYQAAENLVADGDCDQAITSFEKYLNKFPKGLFATNSNYYLADCAYRKNDYPTALSGFEYVVEQPIGQFTEPSLLGAAVIRMKQNGYKEALAHFMSLEGVAEFSVNVLRAQKGQMRANYQLGNYEDALVAIEKVLSSDNLTDELEVEARLNKARINFTERDYEKAELDYEWLAAKKSTEEGAEAKFRLAQIAYSREELDGAEATVFELIKEFPASDYWKVKSFILLADVYAARDDFFQAKATLQSVIDNVETSALVKEAQTKLDLIVQKENEFMSAGDTIAAPDTLDYEDEYRELIKED